MIVLLVIFMVGFIVWYIVHLKNEREADRARMDRDVSRYERAIIDGANSHDSSSAFQSVEDLKCSYSLMKDQGYRLNKDVYEADLYELSKRARDLKRWENRIEKILDQFRDCFFIVTDSDFSDVDHIYTAKRRCIRLWQECFSIADKMGIDNNIIPNIKEYMKIYLDDDYDPCMYSHNTLEKRLNECIIENRPENRRKKELLKLIINVVAEQNTVLRSKLLKRVYSGFSGDEVKCCYKQLVADNRLAEIKIGNRYFVTLSVKESSKFGKTNNNPKENTSNNQAEESITLDEFYELISR